MHKVVSTISTQCYVIYSVRLSFNMRFLWCFIILPVVHGFIETVFKTVTTKTKHGPIKGVETSVPGSDERVMQYRRVPFAKPPVGELRFSKPEASDGWDGTLDATEFGPSCMQREILDFDLPNKQQSEDCLFLNIYVPTRVTQSNEKLSVMVWIHGGGYAVGQGMYYNASTIAISGNVIVVTINYRLGIFGFFTLNNDEARGNYGLWDQIQALKWINENIGYLRGDSKSVTIFGESAGGFSTTLLALYPPNRGLFQRVISQSGTAFSHHAMSIVSEQASKLMSVAVGCIPSDPHFLISCLRSKTASEILEVADALPTNVASPTHFHMHIGMGPVVDGELFPDVPLNLVTDEYQEVKEFFQSIDYITGTTNAEGSLLGILMTPQIQEKLGFKFSDGISSKLFKSTIARSYVSSYHRNNKDVLNAIIRMYTDDTSIAAQGMRAVDMFGDSLFVAPAVKALLLHATNNNAAQTYQYEMALETPVPFPYDRPPWFTGTGHIDDLMYLFFLKTDAMRGKNIPKQDYDLSAHIIQYWTNFAKTGNPNLPRMEGLPDWPQFLPSTQLYMELNTLSTVKDHLKAEAVKFWLETVPGIANANEQTLKDLKDEL